LETYVVGLAECGMRDIEHVGGKNASLGEMIGNLADLGVRVPGGFATTARAYREFLDEAGLNERIHDILDNLNVDDVRKLTQAGAEIRQMILDAPFPDVLRDAVTAAWNELCGGENIEVAVRSSATAEDLPDASFAGQ